MPKTATNPYFGQPARVDPEGYLGGGRDFGPVHRQNSVRL